MDIKQMLNEYSTYSERVQKLNTKINEALKHKINYDGLKAQNITGMPHGSGLSDPTYQAVEQIIEKWDTEIRKMAEEVNRLIDNKTTIDKALRALPWNEYRVIEMHYIMGLNLERVATEMSYTYKHVTRLHGWALEKIRKVV